MTATELLAELDQRGLSYRVDGPDLIVSGLRSLPPEIVTEIKQHKAEIIAALVEPVVAEPRRSVDAHEAARSRALEALGLLIPLDAPEAGIKDEIVDVKALFADLTRRGIELSDTGVNNGLVAWPKKKITPTIAEQIRQNKDALLELVRERLYDLIWADPPKSDWKPLVQSRWFKTSNHEG